MSDSEAKHFRLSRARFLEHFIADTSDTIHMRYSFLDSLQFKVSSICWPERPVTKHQQRNIPEEQIHHL